MDRRYVTDLEQLRMTILKMATLSEAALGKALRAFFERDTSPANEVIRGDQEINLLEVDVDKDCLRLLALDQPVARDLRFIIGCMRIAIDLERIADEAVNVAEKALFLINRIPLPLHPDLEQLAERARAMLRLVIDAFIMQNVEQAREVCRMDKRADELNVAVLESLLDYMVKEVPAVERSVQTILVARSLERVADQATNIGENIIFMVQGINVKHRYGRS